MKILYMTWLDAPTTDVALFLSRHWECQGHQVILYPYDTKFTNTLPGQFLKALGVDLNDARLRTSWVGGRLRRVCDASRPDVVLLGGDFLAPEDVAFMKTRYGCIVGDVMGYNDLLVWPNAECARLYDFVFVHDSYMMPVLKGDSLGRLKYVFWTPFMAEPTEHCPLVLDEADKEAYGCDVAFIGQPSSERVRVLSCLSNCKVKVWGTEAWLKTPLAPFYSAEPVYGLKKTKIYNAAQIVLNIQDGEKQVNAVSNRVTETLACGGFVLTDWHSDLDASPLRDGVSVATYRKVDEIPDKVVHYLAHPDQRQCISEAGRRIVLNELTYERGAARMAAQMVEVLDECRGR